MIELILEVLFQFVLEGAGEALFEAGYKGTARLLRSRITRFVIGSAIGLGAGVWWGARLSEAGRVQAPRALWISLVLALAFGLAALWRWQRGRRPGDDAVMSPPWRWPAYRLVGFALLNVAVAAGMALAFEPQPLG